MRCRCMDHRDGHMELTGSSSWCWAASSGIGKAVALALGAGRRPGRRELLRLGGGAGEPPEATWPPAGGRPSHPSRRTCGRSTRCRSAMLQAVVKPLRPAGHP
ncbi:MAG: hypothetical protein MZU91_00725 [Desulfosudis oleivorans]|nr:hypothetical protein [Desulfosudis oleivorans]